MAKQGEEPEFYKVDQVWRVNVTESQYLFLKGKSRKVSRIA
jgi:hypothetical protein